MASYSVAEARNRFADLIDRAEAGETVTITRRGKPVADLAPRRERPLGKIDLDLVRRYRVYPDPPLGENAVDLIRRMRDEDEV